MPSDATPVDPALSTFTRHLQSVGDLGLSLCRVSCSRKTPSASALTAPHSVFSADIRSGSVVRRGLKFVALSERQVMMPSFHHSVAVLPLSFRRSAFVKFRSSVKIT